MAIHKFKPNEDALYCGLATTLTKEEISRIHNLWESMISVIEMGKKQKLNHSCIPAENETFRYRIHEITSRMLNAWTSGID